MNSLMMTDSFLFVQSHGHGLSLDLIFETSKTSQLVMDLETFLSNWMLVKEKGPSGIQD